MRKFNLFNHSSGQEERQITTSCLSLYSDLPLTCPLPDSVSLVSRQSVLDTCGAERTCTASGARVAQEWLKYVAVIFLVLTLGVGNVWGDEVTFTANVETGTTSITKSGITISATDGTFSRSDNYRVYANKKMTVSSEVGNITKVVVNCTASGTSDYGPGKFSGTGYSYSGKVGTWTGSSTSVTLSASAQVRITSIVVTTASSYTIGWSITSGGGTLSVTSGTSTTVTPASGWRYASPAYTVLTGTATVAQSTNTFTATPTANSTIRINMEQIPTHAIHFNTGGLVSIADATGIREGDTYNLTQDPSASLTSSCEYGTFVGWTTASSIANASVCPTIVTSVTMSTTDVTLYAVYSKTVGGGGAAIGTTMWAESFDDYEANDTPASPGESATKYNNASISYSYTNGNGNSPGTTKVATTDIGAGGESPELMIGKKGSGNSATTGGSFSIRGIPSGGATTLTLSYRKNNRTISNPSISGTGYSITAPSGSNPYTCTITCGSASTFSLTFTATTTNNVRMDEFSISVATTSNAGTTTYSLDAGCCTPLAQVEGSANLSQWNAGVHIY